MSFFRIITTCLFLFSGFGFTANSQISAFYGIGDSLTGCESYFSFHFVADNLDDQVDLTIDWGDGTQNTYPYSILGNTYVFDKLYHDYANPGNYSATIQIYSTVLAAMFDVQQYSIISLPANECAYFNSNVYQNTPYFTFYEAILDCIGADGQVTSVQLNQYNQGYGLDRNNAPYVVSVNSQWLSNNGYTQVSPNQTIAFFDSTGLADNGSLNFEIDCSQQATNPDFLVFWMVPFNFIAPLQTGTVQLSVCNIACGNTDGATANLTFPNNFVPNTMNLVNASVNGNTLSFDVLPFMDCETILIPFTFPGNIVGGTEICFDLVLLNPNDSNHANDSTTSCSFVLNSYDPNAKQTNKPLHIDANSIESLQYEIHFQNDGNYNAVNIELIDTLSSNLDLSTFKFLGSKHPVTYSIDPVTRILKFQFYQINLTPSLQNLEASQGFVVYEISEISGLPLQSEIKNTAYIYFDYNSPIITNTTLNINSVLAVNEIEAKTIEIYPNPSSGIFTFGGEKLDNVEVFDLTGKQVFIGDLKEKKQIDISFLENGIYTGKITNSTGTYSKKIVIRK